jgi:hypothetical protein
MDADGSHRAAPPAAGPAEADDGCKRRRADGGDPGAAAGMRPARTNVLAAAFVSACQRTGGTGDDWPDHLRRVVYKTAD